LFLNDIFKVLKGGLGHKSGTTPMRLPSYLTRSSTGRYQFRMRVPTDMRGIVGKPFVKHPLGIQLHSARVAALAIAQRYAQHSMPSGMGA
jgi:hypothetical protein